MLRKLCLITTILFAIVLMAGCNLKDKIGNNLSEKAAEKALGDNADVNIDNGDVTVKTDDGEMTMNGDDDGITIKGEDGSVVTAGDSAKWPKGQVADYIPMLDVGTVTYGLNTDQACMVTVENTTVDDYKKYVDAVAGAGYTEEKVESSAVDMQVYSAKATNGVVVTVSYVNSESTLNITVDAAGKQ